MYIIYRSEYISCLVFSNYPLYLHGSMDTKTQLFAFKQRTSFYTHYIKLKMAHYLVFCNRKPPKASAILFHNVIY